jgi:hypothetical protein
MGLDGRLEIPMTLRGTGGEFHEQGNCAILGNLA